MATEAHAQDIAEMIEDNWRYIDRLYAEFCMGRALSEDEVRRFYLRNK